MRFKHFCKESLKIFLWSIVTIIVLFLLSLFVVDVFSTPSNSREWNDDQNILPTAIIRDNFVDISHVRNFSYTTTKVYTPSYYDRTYNLDDIVGVWYIVEPFEGIRGSAHTFLSFEFVDNVFLSISIEIRKEKGETFHPLKGLYNQYELTYVVADERDVIALRTNYRKDLVYLYKTTANKEKSRALFLDMIERVNALAVSPEFYNTVTNNCTTNIVKHINAISADRIPSFSLESVFPAYSDALAYSLGLLDTTLPLAGLQKQSLINEKAMLYGSDVDFSSKIRQ